jgi:hypothetical protein
MQSGFAAWFHESLGGIRPAAPGFKRIELKPHGFTQLEWVKTSHDSPYGTIRSDWRSQKGKFEWNITVPANTTATIYVPARDAASVIEGGRAAATRPGVKFVRFENGRAVFEVESGSYQFSSRPAAMMNALAAPVASTNVVAIDWTKFQAGRPADTNAQLMALILNNACKYALNTWWTNWFAGQDAATYLTFGGNAENNIRPAATQSMGLTIALQTGVFDPKTAGQTATEARDRTLKMVRSLSYRHLANTAGGWGNAWQSAHWATCAYAL